jgi:lysozyme
VIEHIHHIIGGLTAALIAIFAVLGHRKRVAAVASPAPAATPTPTVWPRVDDGLTARAAMELIGHEAIVCESYKDSEGIWTWGIGVTDASGHKVARYIDKPQPIEHCLEVYIWLLRKKYLPDVLKAFKGHVLTEAQLAAALSFHYNTGSILSASWVKLWTAGNVDTARTAIMQWTKPASIIERREKERDLFFDGRWSSDGKARVIPVNKPSYQPSFRNAKRVDVLPMLQELLG